MCGDLDDENPLETALYGRFRSNAKALQRAHGDKPGDPGGGLASYMDRLFADALARCIRDSDGETGGYRTLAAQPVVFARLAGFLAGHCARQEDPLRQAIEALMHGYAEAERAAPAHGHDHDHGRPAGGGLHHHHDH